MWDKAEAALKLSLDSFCEGTEKTWAYNPGGPRSCAERAARSGEGGGAAVLLCCCESRSYLEHDFRTW